MVNYNAYHCKYKVYDRIYCIFKFLVQNKSALVYMVCDKCKLTSPTSAIYWTKVLKCTLRCTNQKEGYVTLLTEPINTCYLIVLSCIIYLIWRPFITRTV